MRLVVVLWCAFIGAAARAADERGWHASSDGVIYAYADRQTPREDSLLNPDNQIARLARRRDVAELRFNFRAENETLRLTARSIASWRDARNEFGGAARGEAYLSQWQARVRAGDRWNLAAGRDLLNWGAGQFRSPSSPFYFDNGRTDPLRELVGMDSVKLSWTPDTRTGAHLAYIAQSGYGAARPDAWRESWLAKLDRRGDEWAYGLVAAKAPRRGTFLGAHGQYVASDALMLYGEAGSSVLPATLRPPPDTALPHGVQSPSPRRATALVGGAYTFEDGRSLSMEYLREGHGFSREEERAHFQRAATQYGLALALMPRLLGRDYLHVVLQSNIMNEKGYWRLMATRNLADGGNEYSGYGEIMLASRLGLYLLAVLPQGDARQEASALIRRRAIVGIRVTL